LAASGNLRQFSANSHIARIGACINNPDVANYVQSLLLDQHVAPGFALHPVKAEAVPAGGQPSTHFGELGIRYKVPIVQ
jgi:hypothetical protein